MDALLGKIVLTSEAESVLLFLSLSALQNPAANPVCSMLARYLDSEAARLKTSYTRESLVYILKLCRWEGVVLNHSVRNQS